ncbi:peptidoglycan DD-metalloendopeptidase family protein [Neobacillus sp. PS3-34]|uniref:M23 family metallopeptidase n=1 Tax=Neobacillus sp. PS3-34 TaxID=3070678 RepID=UPI0027E17BEA|nr:peptidoglycan DD-metalloendopeptidase family protein [Neobacillus sp. PS3-34]WML50614.1 peptidoglycan DD-metalloendopeptidase family protein [Neobacillus sp. PS3-34]
MPTATVHTVQSGEYLSLIAKKYQTTVSEIKRLNSLSSDTVFLGQELKITEGSIPAPAFLADGMFPMAKGTYTSFQDTWGNSRQFGGNRVHEGTDIMASKGTRLYAVTDGTVTNYGWNELGGWRVTIRTQEGYYLYYAHLNKYAAGIGFGSKVKKGQLVGYVGNTGYGP